MPRGLISEVVVTARKRGDERLQEIPTAISAFSEQALQDMGVNEFTDFAYQVPGLTFSHTGNGEKRYIDRLPVGGQEQVAVYYTRCPPPASRARAATAARRRPIWRSSTWSASKC